MTVSENLFVPAHPNVAPLSKLVLLTAGCPETCHRTIANLAREIEARGVPTLIISASPAATESVRPPRAMTFDGS
ncbi:MAG TPA: hypothetical protein VF962_02720, partial [Gemmatimonadaceae bacterium]